MRRFFCGLAVFVFAALVPAIASAAIITFDLTCELGSQGCDTVASVGKVTLTDDGDVVHVSVDLTNGSNVDELYLNYDETKYSGATDFTANNADIDNDINGQKADGYPGFFDLLSPSGGNAGVDPYTFTLAVTGEDLNAIDFVFKDTDDLVYLAVKTVAGGNFYGSLESILEDPQVPEPASLLLLGLGLAAAARARRR